MTVPAAAVAGTSPECSEYGARRCGGYLGVAEMTLRLRVKTMAKGEPRAAVEGSPEFFLRRRAPGVHRLVVLVHEKQKGSISGMRKIARKLMEQVGKHGESYTRRNSSSTVTARRRSGVASGWPGGSGEVWVGAKERGGAGDLYRRGKRRFPGLDGVD